MPSPACKHGPGCQACPNGEAPVAYQQDGLRLDWVNLGYTLHPKKSWLGWRKAASSSSSQQHDVGSSFSSNSSAPSAPSAAGGASLKDRPATGSSSQAGPIQLIKGISGGAEAGRLMALMGPSGAGKSTLLNLLAGDAATLAGGTMAGQVLLNGAPRDVVSFRKVSCYVRQVDVLLATCTVKETLQFHAALRLPHHWTQGQRAAAVDRVLTQLGLTSCADTRVGDETAGMKGVSGGERRRLAIGVELIRNPSIIFLDEPTTGLDSATALQVVSCIAKVAQQHPAAVIMSVHQPGPEVCALFDDLVLLAAGGRCCFMGPWKQAVPWFKNVLGRGPGVMQAEAEWFLSLLTDSCSPASGDESPGTPNSSSGRKNNSSSKRSAGGAMEDGTLASTSTSSTSSQGVDLLVDRWSTKAVKAPGGAPSAEAAQDLQQQQQQQQLARPTIIVVAPGYDAASDRSGDSPSSTVSSQGQLPTFSRGGKGASGRGEAGGGGGLVRALSRSLSSAAPGGGSSTTQHKQLVSSRSAALTAAAAAAAGGAWGEEAGRRPNWLAVSAREVAVLSGRSLRWWGRNPAMLVSEILQYGFACVFLGSLYPQLAPVVPAGVPDRLTALFTFVVTLMVTAPSRALLAWDVERKLLRWELTAGTYRLTSFLLSKILVTVPLEAIQVLVVGAGYYLLVGFQRTAVKFWYAMAFMVLTAVNAATAGLLVGLLTPNLDMAFPLLCLVCTVLLSFCGFMVQNVPVYWKWVGPISFCSYAYAGLVRNEFSGLAFTAPLSSSTSGSGAGSTQQFASLAMMAPSAALAPSSSSSGSGAEGVPASAFAAAVQQLAAANATITNTTTGQPLSPAALFKLFSNSSAGGSTGGGSTAGGSTVNSALLDGMTLVPSSIPVNQMDVGGFLGVMVAFTFGGWLLALLLTVLSVKLRAHSPV